MIQKIKRWLRRGHTPSLIGKDEYTLDHVKNAYRLGLQDGKKEGLRVAREQAQKSLSEILRHQNN